MEESIAASGSAMKQTEDKPGSLEEDEVVTEPSPTESDFGSDHEEAMANEAVQSSHDGRRVKVSLTMLDSLLRADKSLDFRPIPYSSLSILYLFEFPTHTTCLAT